MSTQRGRIRISGFDPQRVKQRESLSDWVDKSGTEPESRWWRALRRFRRNRSAMIGIVVVTVLTLLAIFARPITIMDVTVQPFSIAPFKPDKILYLDPAYSDISRYNPPTGEVLLGTDGNGRDILSRLLYGGRFSLSIGFVVVFITAIIGTIYGAISGYYGGLVDEVLMRILDVIFAFPPLVLALVIIATLGGGYWQIVLALTATGWAGYARIIRGEILSVKENEYVMAAKALGARDRSVIFRHVVPNALAPVVVQASLSVGVVVIAVAALGFLGVGLDPTTAEWGTMLETARSTIIQGPGSTLPWWSTFFPGLAIFMFVMSMNLIGDGINDALDAQETIAGPGGGG